MIKILRWIFNAVIVKTFIYVCLGLNVKQAYNLPKKGPAILICNHNSHLDTFVLTSLFPVKLMMKISPVAASEYFLRNKLVAWFVLNIVNIIPLSRSVSKSSNIDFFQKVDEHINNGGILILYPEGSRGEPEHLDKLKSGIFHIAQKHPDVPVIPCYTHGLGMVLPKNEMLLVPAICDILVENPIKFIDDKNTYMNNLSEIFQNMRNKIIEKEQ